MTESPDLTHVRVSGIEKRFPAPNGSGEIEALGPISVALKRGEFFSIVGPSGCGKSTMLEIIAGLTMPTAGEILVGAQSIARGVPEGVGVVFQEDATFPWLNVYDNIAFGLRHSPIGKVSKEEAGRRIEGAISLMGLNAFRAAFPAQLSGGMRQRVCIARTLVLQPSLILLDEPFGALDQQTRLLMGDEVLRLWRATGATILLITHSLDEAAMLSDRVGVMSARPGQFIEIIETNWPKDRDSRLAGHPEFGAVQARLWELLRDQSLQSMREAGA